MNKGIIYALLASILWGLNYVLFEKVMNKVNVFTMMFIEFFVCTIVAGILCFVFGNFKLDLQNLQSIKYTFIANLCVYLIATFLITFSIKYSNATVAGLIEISYPLFIILASYLIFGDNHISPSVIIGGVLIFAGVTIITLAN